MALVTPFTYESSVALTSPIDVVLGRVTVPLKVGPARGAREARSAVTTKSEVSSIPCTLVVRAAWSATALDAGAAYEREFQAVLPSPILKRPVSVSKPTSPAAKTVFAEVHSEAVPLLCSILVAMF
jgi:hypothetical protein